MYLNKNDHIMLPQLKFNEKMFNALIEGRKTVTRRKDPKDICEGLFVSAVCSTGTERPWLIKCTNKYPQKISEMTEKDALKEGFCTLQDFRKEIADIYGQEYLDSDPTMWVYEFMVVGKPA